MMANTKLDISTISKSSGSITSSEMITQLYSGLLRGHRDYSGTRDKKSSKNRQVGKMLFLLLLPIALLLGFILYFMGNILMERTAIHQVRSDLTFCLQLGRLVHHIQHERDVQNLDLEQVGRRRYLLIYFDKTDEAITELPTVLSGELGQVPGMEKYNISHIKMQLWQGRVVSGLKDSNEAQSLVYTDTIGALLKLQLTVILRLQYQGLWKLLVAYYKLINSTEQVGKQIQLASQYLINGQFKHESDLPAYVRVVDQTKNLITRSSQYIPEEMQNIANVTNKTLLQILKRYPWADPATAFKEVYEERLSLPPSQAVAKYFDVMTVFKNSIFEFQEMLAELIQERIDEYDQGQMMILGVGIMLTLVVAITCPLLIRMVYRLTTQLQQCATNLADATKELRVEKRRTDTLLYQMLPKSVAQKLKKGQVEAEYFRSASILFCGVEDFTEMTLNFSPTDIVNFLNDLFCTLDEITDKFDVYKVETVGDIYMLSSGVPERNGYDHAAVVGSCALQMLGGLGQLRTAWSTDVSLLIGINTGSCMAAVIGINRPRYCLFGDTVNTASRMQTSSQGNRIQITETTEKYLRKTKRFITEPRGRVDIKGKGFLFTHWLLEEVSQPELHPHHGVMMSVTSSDLDHSGSSGLGRSITSSRGLISSSVDGTMTPVEQPVMSAIPEADIQSSNSSETPIPTCEPVLPIREVVVSPLDEILNAGVDWRVVASPTPVGNEVEFALQRLDERFKAKAGSPPIVQLTEGFHF